MVEAMRTHINADDCRKGERGAVMALATIAMLSLLLATGLAVDISHFYSIKAEMQNAADAAAVVLRNVRRSVDAFTANLLRKKSRGGIT